MSIRKPSELGGGTYFKPADHQNTVAILIEPTEHLKDQPHSYKGRQGVRDVLIANLTFFETLESVEKGEPTEIVEGAKITHSMLVRDGAKVLGEAMIGVPREIETQAGSGFVWRDVDANVEEAIVAYYEKREAALAAAVAEAPSFD